jgi:putative toxin-antitoxin system antitoxin component (TIGR02293 family)
MSMAHPKSSSQAASSEVAGLAAAAVVKRKAVLPEVAKGKSAAQAGPNRKTAPFAGANSKNASSAQNQNNTWKLSYLSVYRASPLERISLIKSGIPASEVKQLFADLNIGQGVGFKALNLSTATVNKKAKKGDVLSSEESERVIGFAKLVGQLEAMVEESGGPSGFDARAWMARWLTEPLPAFGGAHPADLIDTMEGQGLVSAALARLQSGAYA